MSSSQAKPTRTGARMKLPWRLAQRMATTGRSQVIW
jgi:hypothetical protein